MRYSFDQLEVEFKTLTWDKVYSFIEFLLLELEPHKKRVLTDQINDIFLEEGAQYRIIDDKVTQLMDEIEINEIVIAGQPSIAAGHIKKATEFFNKRPKPDYPNSIKESISAVEAISKEITNNPSATLGSAVKNMGLPSLLEQGITKIYAWTSDEGGIRHSVKNDSVENYGEPEARYMLVLCSALVNFLKKK